MIKEQLSERDQKYCLEEFDKQKEEVIFTFNHFLSIEPETVGEWTYNIVTPGGRCKPLRYEFILRREYNDHTPECYTNGHYQECFDEYVNESTKVFFEWLNDENVNRVCDSYCAYIEMRLSASRSDPKTRKHDVPLYMSTEGDLKLVVTKWTF